MNDLLIRSYKSSDNQEIKDLYKLASVESEIGFRDGPWYKDFDIMENFYMDKGDFLVGVMGNKIVAMIGLEKSLKTVGHIRRMRVHPEYRRRGYAQALLKELEDRAVKKGFTELRLRTSIQQIMAQRLYEKNGYSKMKSKKEFYLEGPFEVIWYRKLL